MEHQTSIATPDLLYGVKSIAEFLGIKERSAQHLVETRRIPYFKVGKTVCARRSKVLAAFDQLEESNTAA